MRTNKFIPFLIALLLHLIPLSYFLFAKTEVTSVSEGNSRRSGSRMMDIDLTTFSVAHKTKSSAPKTKPSKIVGLPSTTATTGNSSSENKTGNGNGSETGSGSGSGNSSGPSTGPHFLQMHEPPYPPIARQKGLEGKVKIKAFYNAEGNIVKVDITESSGTRMLDESVKKTVRDWKVSPGNSGEFDKTFEFKLKN